jgi:hypothetical protein
MLIMKKVIFFYVFFGILLIGCHTKNSDLKKSKIKEQERSESIELIKTVPKFTSTTNSNEIRQTCESVITMINDALPKLKKAEKKLTYQQVPNTPVTIWYSNNNLPVKIECAVTDDSGKFTDKIQFYFINGQFWYSDQIFARYIFDSDKLIFWMDENWRINKIPAGNFKERESTLKSDVAKFLY